MAKLTKNKEYIVEQYVRYFGKTPTKAQIDEYADLGKPKLILAQIRGESQDAKEGMSSSEYVNSVFQNLFGRNASTKELNKYSKFVDKGEDLPINAIVKAAKPSDKAVYQTKQAVALFIAEKGSTTNIDLDKITKDTYAVVYDLKAKKVKVDSVEELKTKVDAMKDNVSGQTITLTTGVDTKVGSDKGDLFEGIVDTAGKSTLTALDSIDGKEGKDTLNILNADATALKLPAGLVVKNVEIVNVKSADDVGSGATSFDVSGFTGLTDLNITQAKAAYLEAAATTNVNVSGATGAIDVDGGKNVDIKAAGNAVTSKGAAGTVTVTDAGKAATATSITVENGTDVTVNATTDTTGTIKVGDTTAPHDAAKAATGDVEVNSTFTTVAATDATANAISVDGGKTITVNQMVTSSDTVLANTTGQTITQGAVVITGQDTTTTVTVKQEKSTAENPAVVAVAEKLSTSTVTFKGMASGQSVTVNGLTFTASKALTAAEVAAAFANLEIGDTQVNSGPTANGIFTGVNGTAGTAIWTSGAVTNVDATTSTVTYSANVAGAATALVVANSGAPVPVASAPTVGVLAVDAEAGVTGIVNGAVSITDGGIDSIKTISVDGYATSTINANLLETLTLANSGGATAGATNAAMTVTTASTGSLTLNLDNVNGNVSLDGGAATLTGLNITTTGEKSDFALTAAAVTSLTVAAAADLDISTGSTLTAVKTVTITGAGDVNLGDLSALADFATLTASAATGDILASVDGDLVTVTTGSGNDSITVKAATEVKKAITLGAGDDRLDLSTITTVNATTAGGAGSDTVVLTATNANDTTGLSLLATSNIFKTKVTGFEKLGITNDIGGNTTVNVGNLGYNHVITNAIATHDLTLADMANNGKVELNAAAGAANEVIVLVKDAATNNTDVLNVVLNVDAGEDHGTLTVANVETIKITATDSTPVNTNTGAATINTSDFILAATSAKTVTITGNAHLDLDMTGNTAATLIDGSTMTGDLTVTAHNAGMTVKGGAGNDTLSVVGAKSGVVLTGGKGTDTFDVSAFDANGNAGTAVTITDLTAGETIKFANTADKFVSSKITLISEATFTEYVAEAAKVANDAGAGKNIAWFQFNNNTFIVQDAGTTNGTFDAGDIIVKINGVKDLSTASFNATDDTLVIA